VTATDKLEFHKSARMFAIRMGALLLLTFAGLALLTRGDFLAASIMTGLGGLVAVVWYVLTQHQRVVIQVDHEAIRRIERDDSQRIRWVDVSEVALGEVLVPQRDEPVAVRFVLVRGMGSQKIAFSDLTYLDGAHLDVGAPDPTPVTDVAQADVLLGLVADRVHDERLLPASAAATALDEPGTTIEDAPVPRERKLRAGLFALFVKLGAKAVKPALGFFKGTQGVLAAASVGALALVLSWQAALALALMLVVHELGHAHAMRRCGLRVRGIYFIPFLGAATVPEDVWRTRGQQARVALSGPLWSTALNLIPAAVLAASGSRDPMLFAITGLMALLNIMNLLPIAPLDGGRLLSAIASSLGTRVGLVVSSVVALAVVGLAFAVELYLFVLLGAIGFVELAAERSVMSRSRLLARAGRVGELEPEGLARLRQLTRPAFPGDSEQKLRELELTKIRRANMLARVEPMSARGVVAWGALYLALLVVLAGLLFWIAAVHPDLEALRSVLS
jgi:Zn-dependent protease